MSQHYWDTDVENVEELLRSVTNFPLHRWKCPCNELSCSNYVVYGRFMMGGVCKVVVMSTMTFAKPPPYAAVLGPDGIDKLVDEPILHPTDRDMYKLYFDAGLREQLRKLFTTEVN